MFLTLTVLRCPDRVAPETRTVGGGELVLGRGPGADWVLADPSERPQISRRHCTLAFAAGAWTLTDTSTNGTLLNGEPTPPGKPSRGLRDGDRLRLGAYEIELGLGASVGRQEPAPAASRDFAPSPFEASPFGASPYGGPTFASDTLEAPAGDHFAPSSVRLPDDFASELFTPEPARPAAQADHTPAQSDVFQAPRARNLLPTSWDDEPHAAAARPSVAPEMPASDFLAEAGPAAEPVPRAPAIQAAPAAAMPATDESGVLAAFLDGAGMADSRPADPAAAMREAGAAFRAFVHGLRRALMARAEVKSAFRIDQTMVSARGNNPLKFSAGDDDALAALLGLGRRTDMRASAAVEGALTDIRQHELATMAAMQDAVRELMGRLDPTRFRAAAEGGLLPAQRRARAFDLYEAEYGKLREALSEKLDDAFGRAFAVAYERVVADLQSREPPL